MAGGDHEKMVDEAKRKLFTIDGAVALASFFVLVVGLFVGSMVGRVVCGFFSWGSLDTCSTGSGVRGVVLLPNAFTLRKRTHNSPKVI